MHYICERKRFILRNWLIQLRRYKSKICRVGGQAGNPGKETHRPSAGRSPSCSGEVSLHSIKAFG